MPNNQDIFVLGVDAENGNRLIDPMSYSQAASIIKGEPQDTLVDKLNKYLKGIWQVISQPHLGLPAGVNADDVTQAGWGIVFHKDEEQAIKDALAPLVEHRQQQVGDENRVKVLEYNGQQAWTDWLATNGVGPGVQIPWKVPYYLLLIGSPTQIPYAFSQLLNVEYAVGRLQFDDAAGYTQYVESVIAYENDQAPTRAKEAVFFGTRHDFDQATILSADQLLDPLADGLPAINGQPAEEAIATSLGFKTRKLRDATATKAALAEVLAPPTGSTPPAFLFTASHGAGFKKPSHDQEKIQGALVCQDWPGFGKWKPEHYFAASDVPDDSKVHGMIGFHFACFSAGIPSHDRFMHKPNQPPVRIAEKPFIASLPKALLSHPQGGALAFIGHVELAWSYSIATAATGALIQPFRNAIHHILSGKPVGYALKDFNERYAALNTRQVQLLEDASFGKQIPNKELATNWIKRNDAEGYMVVGDPAVRLHVASLL